MASPASPLQDVVFNVRTYGAVGDGMVLDTAAIQAAIDACHRHGGGTVVVPAGRYRTGALSLYDHVTLYLNAGCVLAGSQDPADYPVISSRWEGSEQLTYAPLISGSHLTHVTIAGQGIIDGCGQAWWQAFKAGKLAYPRPRLIGFNDCTHLLLEGVTLRDSPSWTINPVRCENVNLHGLTILNPADAPNTDGIDPDSCRFVHISNCHISAGDDCIAIKSGSEGEPPERRLPCRDLTIANCTFARGHGGVVIGSEMSGGVQNVAITNCIFVDTDRAIRIKSRRGRGGVVENVRASNLVMENVLCPFTINMYYGCGAWGDPAISDRGSHPFDQGTPTIRHIHVSQVTANHIQVAAAYIEGLAERPVEDISFSDVTVSLAEGSSPDFPEMADGLEPMHQAGFVVRNARRVLFEKVRLIHQCGPAFDVHQSTQVELISSGAAATDHGEAVARLVDSDEIFLHACKAVPGDGPFLKLEGERTA
ncbi:MAG: glycoside hydrolase family 28 protein, partial [Chloroflexi bacterium]|nr:glycoside hydrolase family 28 protein [Chloroflexota bacterium]